MLCIVNVIVANCIYLVWQVIAMIQKLLQAGKTVTQREAYYSLVQHFKNQSEFNDVLQGYQHYIVWDD